MKTKLLSALIIIVSQFVAYGQSISATISPNPVVAGNDVTIDVTFTSSNSTDIIQLNLERVNASYVYVSTVDYQEFVVFQRFNSKLVFTLFIDNFICPLDLEYLIFDLYFIFLLLTQRFRIFRPLLYLFPRMCV